MLANLHVATFCVLCDLYSAHFRLFLPTVTSRQGHVGPGQGALPNLAFKARSSARRLAAMTLADVVQPGAPSLAVPTPLELV